jgi:hypothetical protein
MAVVWKILKWFIGCVLGIFLKYQIKNKSTKINLKNYYNCRKYYIDSIAEFQPKICSSCQIFHECQILGR